MKTSAGLHYESLFSTGLGWAGGPDENLILLLGHFWYKLHDLWAHL